MNKYRSLAPDIERIRARLHAMRTEREAVMDRLSASREHAEAQRQGRADTAPPPGVHDAPPVDASNEIRPTA